MAGRTDNAMHETIWTGGNTSSLGAAGIVGPSPRTITISGFVGKTHGRLARIQWSIHSFSVSQYDKSFRIGRGRSAEGVRGSVRVRGTSYQAICSILSCVVGSM